MNCVKATSSLLLIASVLGTTAPLRADFGTELLPHMYVGNQAATIEHAHKLPLREKRALREAIVMQNVDEVARLLPLHNVNPKDLMKFLEHVATDVQKAERWRGIGQQTLLGLATFGMFIGACTTERETSSKFGWVTVALSAGSGLRLAMLLAKEGLFNGFRKLPVIDVESKGFLELRGMRQTIAKDLKDELENLFINNRKFVDRAALALRIEKAYSKKQLTVAAIGGAVVLAAAVLYLAATVIRRNTKAATIGAGILGGLASLLSLSSIATPIINERLKRLQSDYRKSLAQVRAETSK